MAGGALDERIAGPALGARAVLGVWASRPIGLASGMQPGAHAADLECLDRFAGAFRGAAVLTDGWDVAGGRAFACSVSVSGRRKKCAAARRGHAAGIRSPPAWVLRAGGHR